MRDVGQRWQEGVPHDPRSVAIYKSVEDLDFRHGGDRFCFKSGGDGDNGEHLMYLLDMHFEALDERSQACSRCEGAGAVDMPDGISWACYCPLGRVLHDKEYPAKDYADYAQLKCSRCGRRCHALYAEDDCSSCMEERHEEVNKRLLAEMLEEAE